MSGLNRFFRWFQPDKPEQPPQAQIVWSNEPPPPMVPEQQDFQPQTRKAILAEAHYEMYAIAADAWQAWRMPSLAKTQRREPIPFDPRSLGRDTGRMIAAAQAEARILVIDGLPLMDNPFAPDQRWHQQTRELIKAAMAAAPLPVKMRLHRLCDRYPERVGIALAIAHPRDQANWHGAKVTQVLPILAGLAVNALGLPVSLIAEADPMFTSFIPAMGTPRWRIEVFEDGEREDVAA